MRLKPIAPEVWAYEDSVKAMPGLHFPTRTVVVRLPGGGLWLDAPLRIDDALADELKALGDVRYLVAPNTFHHMFIGKAAKRYPDAELWLARGLEKKRADLRADGYLDETLPAAWAPAIDAIAIPGAPKLTESVFFHRPSRTLITTDLMFNIAATKGWLSPLVLRMVGAWKRPGQSSMWRAVIKDRVAASSAVREVLKWDFERVVMAHGEILAGADARPALEGALTKVLKWSEPRAK